MTSAADWASYMAQQAERVTHPALSAFYGAAWPAADTPLEQVELLALDVETTGLDARSHSIVSIGLIPMTLERIRSDRAWHTVVRPRGRLEEESVTFHQITHTDIRSAPRFEAIVEPFLKQLAGKVAVVHYHPVERAFLDAAVRRCWGETLQFPMIDTMQIEASLHPRRKPGWLLKLLGRKPVSIRLADSRARYQLPPYRAHHALTDALATAELLQAQVATHMTPQQAVGSIWL
ncbi:MAG TPA: 3'-5' exonuclease [Burkholderiaceae bacterium]|nr:3'-5' exonuclease [Burkholderiaceae bacterium]